MNVHVEHLIEKALALGPEERFALAIALLDSLPGKADAGAAKELTSEIQRRKSELRAGVTQIVTWEQARNRLAAL